MTQVITIRERLYADYQQKVKEEAARNRSRAFFMRNKPYHSTQVLMATVVGVNETNEANVAFAKFAKGQVMSFFNQGIGDQAALGGTATRAVNDADTNVVKAKSTNGATDYSIEGISFGFRDMRVRYTDEQRALLTDSTDDQVIAALSGNAPILDPASICTPPQQQSPFNAEFPMWHGLAGLCAVQLQFDGGQPTFKLGNCDMFPDASAKSQIRASGMPEAGNAYLTPEGYLWACDGQSQSELIVQATLMEDVIVPINLPVRPQDSTVAVTPAQLWVSVVCRLWGTEFQMTNVNG